MADIDYQSLIDEARKSEHGVTDQDIADRLRANGIPDTEYKTLLPNAKFAEAAIPKKSIDAAGFGNVAENLLGGVSDFFSENPVIPAIAGTAAAMVGGKYLYDRRSGSLDDQLKQLNIDKARHELERSQWQFDQEKTGKQTTTKPVTPEPTPAPPPVPEPSVQTNLGLQDLQQRAAQGVKPPVTQEVQTLAPVVDDTTLTMAKVATGEPVVDALPVNIEPPPPDPVVRTEPVVPPKVEPVAIKPPEGVRPSVMSAIEGFAQQHPDVHNSLVADGKVFVPGMGTGDTHGFNAYGKNRIPLLQSLFPDKEFLGTYAEHMAKTSPAMSRITASDVPTIMGKMVDDNFDKYGNYATDNALGKPAILKDGKLLTSETSVSKGLKAGLAGGLIMSIPMLSNAAEKASKGDYMGAVGNALEAGSNVLDAVPVASQVKQGLTPFSTESGTLPQSTKDKLQAGMVGGGRGIAPPSAYDRTSYENRDKYKKWKEKAH